MSAGTLTLTNNSAAVTGSGTAFTTELAAGDFIVVTVGGIPYTLAIKTVNSNTSLTLVSSYTGPIQAGAAWYAVPRVAMNLVTAALVAQSAEALRGLNYDKQNWQSIFSGTGNVTVTLPDGSSFTGPAWNSFTQALNGKANKVSGAVPVTEGGTGATNAGDARSNLGLVDGSGLVPLSIGGTGGKNETEATRNLRALSMNGASLSDVNNPTVGEVGYAIGTATGGTGLNGAVFTFSCANTNAGYLNQLSIPVVTSRLFLRSKNAGNNTWTTWAEFYSTSNTTKSSDGTIKAASPVARIVKSREETERADVAEDGFSWCGCGTANAEAEGIKISRLDVGVYVLTGSAGLASEGWQLLPPMDPGGMGELGVVEAEQMESGGLTIRLYKRKYMLDEEGEIVKTKGQPIDVPANSWIDVRLDMPENSAWNQRQKEAAEPAS